MDGRYPRHNARAPATLRAVSRRCHLVASVIATSCRLISTDRATGHCQLVNIWYARRATAARPPFTLLLLLPAPADNESADRRSSRVPRYCCTAVLPLVVCSLWIVILQLQKVLRLYLLWFKRGFAYIFYGRNLFKFNLKFENTITNS